MRESKKIYTITLLAAAVLLAAASVLPTNVLAFTQTERPATALRLAQSSTLHWALATCDRRYGDPNADFKGWGTTEEAAKQDALSRCQPKCKNKCEITGFGP
jgi:hypothetical protein